MNHDIIDTLTTRRNALYSFVSRLEASEYYGTTWRKRLDRIDRLFVRRLSKSPHTGTREDAVKFALGANRSNGIRRTNDDKRKCIEIALKEFSNLSDRAIAEMCGVSQTTVGTARENQVSKLDTSNQPTTRTGLDGKSYPVKARKQLEPSSPLASQPEAKEPEPAAVENEPSMPEPTESPEPVAPQNKNPRTPSHDGPGVGNDNPF